MAATLVRAASIWARGIAAGRHQNFRSGVAWTAGPTTGLPSRSAALRAPSRVTRGRLSSRFGARETYVAA
jgi:hypothetical protein